MHKNTLILSRLNYIRPDQKVNHKYHQTYGSCQQLNASKVRGHDGFFSDHHGIATVLMYSYPLYIVGDKITTYCESVSTPLSWWCISERICDSSHLRRATRFLASMTSDLRSSGSYLLLMLEEVEVEFTVNTANTNCSVKSSYKIQD